MYPKEQKRFSITFKKSLRCFGLCWKKRLITTKIEILVNVVKKYPAMKNVVKKENGHCFTIQATKVHIPFR